jgi:threonine/homoserine/homoserine lactone efflux protein
MNLTGFVIASFILLVIPGPAVVFIITRALEGTTRGFATILGLATGGLPYALVAALGVSEILFRFPAAAASVRISGAAYLGWLAYRTLRPAKNAAVEHERRGAFLDGFIVNLTNPKAALFFVAFLPQFIEPGPDARTNAVLLVTLFIAMAICTDTAWMLASSALARRIGVLRRWFPFVSSAAYAVLAVVALSSAA